MIKFLYFTTILLIFSNTSYSDSKINFQNYIDTFLWKKRIILLISQKKYVHLINETDNFFKTNVCMNEVRNLKYIRIYEIVI